MKMFEMLMVPVYSVSVLLLSGLTVSAVYVNVSPNRQEFFIRESLSLSCLDDGQPADGWTVMKHSGGHNFCRPGRSDFGRANGSSIIVSDLDNKDTSFYWCEDRNGKRTEHLFIKVQDHVILDVPALPVTTGNNLTLHCQMRNGSTVPAFFFINGSLVGEEPKAELSISNIQKSDEGLYTCFNVTYGRSNRSWLKVRDPPSTSTPPPPRYLQVSLNISPNLQQFFKDTSVSVSCVKDGQTVDGWVVKETINNKTMDCDDPCSDFGRVIGSSCFLAPYLSFSGVFWCETRSGLKSEQATITVTDQPLILEIPALAVKTGSDIILSCRNKNGPVTAHFFKDGSHVGSGSEHTISKVQPSDEGLYSCSTDEDIKSAESRLRVRDLSPTTS